jgi:hypothetical protein
MMRCQDVQDALAARELTEEGLAHLEACADCRALAAARARVQHAFTARPRPPTDPGLVARAVAGAERRGARRGRVAIASATLVAAAAVAVVVGVSWRGRAPGKLAAPRAATATTSPSDTSPEPPTGLEPRATPDAPIVAELLALSDVDASLAQSARWDEALAPIDSMRELAPRAAADVGPRRLP